MGDESLRCSAETHVINGALGYEAQLVNAAITAMAPTKDRVHFEWFGPWENVIGKFIEKTNDKGKKYLTAGWSAADEKGCGVKIWATLKGESEPRVLDLLLTRLRFVTQLYGEAIQSNNWRIWVLNAGLDFTALM